MASSAQPQGRPTPTRPPLFVGGVRCDDPCGMVERLQQHDWADTALGARSGWSAHLRASVDLMAAHGFPMIVLWGPQLLQIYNDGYAEIMADKHPAGLGQPTAECWPEVWHINGPLYEQVWQGRTLTFSDKCYPLQRHGQLQDVWFTITYSPLRAADGTIDGILVTMFDTTAEHVAREARERSEQDLRRSNMSLQANEERFRQFADASSDLLWIRDAETLQTEMLSTAFDAMYGVPQEQAVGDLRQWAARIVADDREAAIANVRDARDGQRRVHEFRIQRASDASFRWIRDTVFPLYDARGRVTRIAGISSDVSDARRWSDRQSVLVAELQHRVRNIMATIGSITLRTRESATSVDDYARRLSGRVMSLARTQALLTRAGNVGIDLEALVVDEVGAQGHAATRVSVHGPSTVIPPKAAEVLSLAIHELATNAQEHGALGRADGHLDISWTLRDEPDERWLDMHWRETCPASADWHPPARAGFGTALVEQRIPYELEGEGCLQIHPDGTEARLSFPLRYRDSILQTDAPAAPCVAGGSVDVGDPALLAGCRVLVVEDDFYQAHDTVIALRSAGALVEAPVASAALAIEQINAGGIDAAVVDANLGQGPEGRLVALLQAAGVPFIVLTGYDPDSVSATAPGLPQVRKPTSAAGIARALASVVHQHVN